MVVPGQGGRGRGRQIRRARTPRSDAEPVRAKWVTPSCREKPLASAAAARTPNRHRWSGREYRGERDNRGQGTRQIAAVTSGEGGPGRVRRHRPPQPGAAAETRPKRLFTKNTGPCEAVRRGIRTDACPVLER